MILKTPYETTTLRPLLVRNLEDTIELALVAKDLRVDQETGVVLLNKDKGYTKDIPSFGCPINVRHDRGEVVVVDVRGYLSRTSVQDEAVAPHIVKPNEYELAVNAAMLQARWNKGNQRDLLAVNSNVQAIFAALIGTVLTSRFQLNELEARYVRIVSAYFYCCQFFDDEELSQRDMNSMAAMIARNTRSSAEDVFAAIEHLHVIKNIEDFVKVLVEQSHAMRLRRLTAGVLLSLVAGSWFGAHTKLFLAVALEYPPMWMAIVLNALSFTIYKRTTLATTALRVAGSNKDIAIRAIREAMKN